MRGTFNLTGIDKYLEAFAAAGKNVDQVVAEVLQEAQPLALELMRDELKRTSETYTGDTEATLYATQPQQDGNFVFVEFGADTGKDPAGLYKEYGRTRQAAEPFLRPAINSHRFKNKIKTSMKAVMERFGLSV
jgi:hypothetical protein